MENIDIENIKGADANKFRYERKFFISGSARKDIENIIRFHPAMFSEIFNRREVNNIYLDTTGFDNYADNVMGISKRSKIRIRWYGETFCLIEKPVLEIKLKNNELGAKISFPLKPFFFANTFCWEVLSKVFSESNLPQWLLEELKVYRISLLNSYTRKYYLSADKRYRITFDYNMKFFNINGRNNNFLNEVNINDSIIVELKYPQSHEKDAAWITNNFPFRVTKSSKYVYGLDILYS